MMQASDIESVPTSTLVQIFRALHDLKDDEVHAVIFRELWLRAADEVGAGVSWQTPSEARWSGLGRWGLRVVRYCDQGSGPNDPAHGPHRRLQLEGMPEVWQCICGRWDAPIESIRTRLNWNRAIVDDNGQQPRHIPTQVWPLKINSAAAKRYDGTSIPDFMVCSRAPRPFDPNHAPCNDGVVCLCGIYIGRAGSGDKAWPSQ